MTRITLIAYGTQGDAQPAVALGKALLQKGHEVRILASANFLEWISGHGLGMAATEIDVQQIMMGEGGQDWVEKGTNPLAQLRIMKRLLNRDGWQMMVDAWHACQGAKVIISSFTSDVYAVSIAEKLGARHISAPPQPSMFATRDGRALLNAPFSGRQSWINYLFGKVVIENGGWQLYGALANRFRQEVLGLPPQNARQNTAARRKMLLVHAYSRHVVPQPADWPVNFHTSGYFFLDEIGGWQPPAELVAFLSAGPPAVGIGFGSMTGRDPRRVMALVLDALRLSGQRAVLLSGWAGVIPEDLPPTAYHLPAAPHQWLFPRLAAVVHHGGAGSTGASLRAGIPTIIVPHMADQPFWGSRVAALGVGPKPLPRPKLTAEALAQRIRVAIGDESMKQRAAKLGQLIRAEDGIGRATEIIERFLGDGTGTGS
jgi:sterol 3beta-glucosyltransferase